jgi:hypothetical protein
MRYGDPGKNAKTRQTRSGSPSSSESLCPWFRAAVLGANLRSLHFEAGRVWFLLCQAVYNVFHEPGQVHFLTCSCYRRKPILLLLAFRTGLFSA